MMSLGQARALATVFKILANDTRLRLLHAIVRSGKRCLTDLAHEVEMTPQAVSNQLQRLVAQGILEAERSGNHVHYWLVDPCVATLLDRGLCLTEDSETRRR